MGKHIDFSVPGTSLPVQGWGGSGGMVVGQEHPPAGTWPPPQNPRDQNGKQEESNRTRPIRVPGARQPTPTIQCLPNGLTLSWLLSYLFLLLNVPKAPLFLGLAVTQRLHK